MDIIETAWLAGILEGEGHFKIQKAGNRLFPRIVLKMTDVDIIRRAMKIMGTESFCVDSRKHLWNSKDCYQTSISGIKAINLMTSILPYMGRRRMEKINEIINLYKNQDPPFKRKCGHTSSIRSMRNLETGGIRTRCIECDRLNRLKRKKRNRS